MAESDHGCYIGCYYYSDCCFRKDCMIRTPPQHQTDPKKAHGQVKDVTLKDYIERKMASEKKKLTFDEWLSIIIPFDDGSDSEMCFYEAEVTDLLEMCWKAAQENK